MARRQVRTIEQAANGEGANYSKMTRPQMVDEIMGLAKDFELSTVDPAGYANNTVDAAVYAGQNNDFHRAGLVKARRDAMEAFRRRGVITADERDILANRYPALQQELQRYTAEGTVPEFQNAKRDAATAPTLTTERDDARRDLGLYAAEGTVDEFKAAKKQAIPAPTLGRRVWEYLRHPLSDNQI